MLELKIFRVWLGAILVMGTISCGYALSAQEKQNATEVAGGTYRIGIGDQLDISVWRHPELSKTVFVDRNGNIRLPLVNAVKTEGLSPNDLEHVLTHRLEQVFANPQVSVIVSKIARPVRTLTPSPKDIRWFCCEG
jgi:polysaccharide export outer membrane protein